jgi:glucose/arabinose dehydrogenase
MRDPLTMRTPLKAIRSLSGLSAISLASLLALQACNKGTEAEGEGVTRDNTAFRPETLAPTADRIAALDAPDGFRVQVFADSLGHARMLAVAEDGTVFLTAPKEGKVHALRDGDGDGEAESVETVLENLPMVHGIAIHGDSIYLAAPGTVWISLRGEDGNPGEPEVLIDDLPDGGQHPNRTMRIGPDGKLYISVGSTCNACEQTDPEHATILRAALDGSDREVFARGLRNTLGFDWRPGTAEMWGMDHGSDGRGNEEPPEELNRLREGKNYGWPFAYGDRQVDPLMDDPREGGMTKEEFAATTEPAALTYTAHSAPIGMEFYRGDRFPERYRNGAFVAFRGSWNRFPATGYKIAYIRFENGQPVEIEDFVTGFLIENGTAHFGRLAGLAIAADGALLFTDDTNGMVYRVSSEE